MEDYLSSPMGDERLRMGPFVQEQSCGDKLTGEHLLRTLRLRDGHFGFPARGGRFVSLDENLSLGSFRCIRPVGTLAQNLALVISLKMFGWQASLGNFRTRMFARDLSITARHRDLGKICFGLAVWVFAWRFAFGVSLWNFR